MGFIFTEIYEDVGGTWLGLKVYWIKLRRGRKGMYEGYWIKWNEREGMYRKS